jgi:AcrR family transcriptional regulator
MSYTPWGYRVPSIRVARTYTHRVPRLWNETIDAHRRAVIDATLDTTATLVSERGLRAVTMSEIAERTGIGRATLYKYFPDVDAILRAWHERQVTAHLEHLAEIRDRITDPGERLKAVLEAYAHIHQQRVQHDHHSTELVSFLHAAGNLAPAQYELHKLIRDLIADGARTGDIRTDVTPDELATYALHALDAASVLPSRAAIRRLVTVTLSGLRSPDGPASR